MARPSLACLAALMTQAGCLVTGSPDIDDPVQTAPFFINASALPNPREIVVIPTESILKQEPVTFSAEFVGEDAGEPLQARYYIDLGIENAAGLPYFETRGVTEFPPGSFDDAPRRVEASVRAHLLPAGCRTFTLMLSHGFDFVTNCPRSLADSTQLTWMYVTCESGSCPLDACPTSEEDAQVPKASCPEVAGQSGAPAAEEEP